MIEKIIRKNMLSRRTKRANDDTYIYKVQKPLHAKVLNSIDRR